MITRSGRIARGVGVGVERGDEGSSPIDACFAEHKVIGDVALQMTEAGAELL